MTKPFDVKRLNEVIREYVEPHLQVIQNSKITIEVVEAVEAVVAEATPVKLANKRNRVNLITSYMCNWNEEIDGQSTSFAVICSEQEDKILIEMNDSNKEKQMMQFSFEGFQQLHDWLENHLGKKSRHA